MTREWNATAYDALPLPHVGWGQRTLDRLADHAVADDARVLDAGCGTGRDAAAALERWPGWRMVLLDGSQRMLDQAEGKLGPRASYVLADLMEPLPITEPVDAVLSVAAFHWVPDHARLFANLAAVMAPGAPLVSDCGGAGNIERVNLALARVKGVAPDLKEFARPAVTRDHLVAAGFDVRDVSLRPDPFRCEDPEILETFLATIILGAELEHVPADDQQGFVREVRIAMGEPEVDYVRLEIDAVRR